MDFRLTEEELLIQKMVRDFSQKEIKPAAAEYERKGKDAREGFPWELWKKAHQLGLIQLPLSKELGGSGANMLTQIIVCEELGAGDGSIGKAFATHLHSVHYIKALFNKQQQEEFVPQLLNDDTFVICSALCEPESGSELSIPYDKAIHSYAYRDGDEYVINGLKHFNTLAAVAKLYYIYVRTDKNKPITEAMSGFIVPANTPGLSIGHIDEPMGGRAECRAEIIIDNVRIPSRYLIGKEGGFFGPRSREFLTDYLCTVAAGVGEARTCYEETLAHAKTRVQGGIPIIEYPNVGTRLADMHVGIEACRTLLQKIAWSWDNQYEFDPKMVLLAKAFISDILSKLFLDSLEIWAGWGIQRESPIERYFRNHFATVHGGGTPAMNRIKVATML
jgi:alkylation response protein AidB-like acyl-CoA dehydrogenase